MPYIPPEVVEQARQIDLLTYLQSCEPQELVRISGNNYTTRTHDSLKISNGKWMWWSQRIGGYNALDYLEENCDVQEPSDNLVIYGHHMSNGSMFAHLEKFKSKDFWNEHRTITFNTLTDKQEYEIVAVFRTVVYTDSPEAFKFYRFIDAESADDFVSFVAKCKELSFYDTGVTAEYGDKLITLSTCEYSRNNSRLVVVAKRITEDGGADAAKTHAEATAEGERPN